MQTFLPLGSFTESAGVLDDKRLGKQRVECLQILNALHNPAYGWQNHPATKMWCGYEASLINYGVAVCYEWIGRGHNDTCLPKIDAFRGRIHSINSDCPAWITPDLCLSHQSNLIRKDPNHYRKHFPTTPDNLPYVWPVQ